MATKTGEGFSSSFGAIMAAAGSAVGLGNIWRFPYICGKYGGGAFLLVYICFVFFIGMVLMMSEFVIGRRTGEDPVKAYPKLRPKHPEWRYVGVIGLITCFLILAIYLVISGWTLNYFWESLTGTLAAISNDGFGLHFSEFASSAERPVVFVVLFLVFTAIIIIGGVEKGIERVSKLLMPILVVLLLILCVRSLTLDGASEGLAYLFQPDFSKLTGEGILAALGQALFSLSVGMGVMIVYGSYLPVDDNIMKSSIWITICDFAIAILSGIAIFPAVFACGQDPTGGPGLVYQVLPVVFNSLGTVGRIFSVVFFLLLSLAALTSAISLLEALTQWLSSEKIGRTLSAVVMSCTVVVLAIVASFSFGEGIFSDFKIFNMQIFDLLDKLTGTILPPLCALMTIIFFGWFMKKDDIYDELSNHKTLKIGYFKIFYYILARYVAPLALIIVLVAGLFGK
ncbi:MAG: sodium-dependent transporter [Bacteroidales bacterium]|nr:sodium-dependent transporter [Bacteroidales bacterium]